MKGADMQEVFEKIIEKLESEYEDIKEIYKRTKDMSFYFTFQGVNKAIEIVKKESEKQYHGHFGCNTNGEHERCDGCGLTNCKSRNKIWFGVSDDNNGWIPCSERLPEYGEVVMCSCTNSGITISCITHKGVKPSKSVRFGQHSVIAWQPLPKPFKERD